MADRTDVDGAGSRRTPGQSPDCAFTYRGRPCCRLRFIEKVNFMKTDFEEQLQLVKQLGFRSVREIPINLAVVVSDKEFNLAGNYFYIKDAPSSEVYIEVKINSSGAGPISWTKQTGFVHPFNRLYITTPTGQTGTMKILIAAEAPHFFEVLDHRIETQILGSLDLGLQPNERTVGLESVNMALAYAGRRGYHIQSKSTNTGKIYIGIRYDVSTTKWSIELQPGQLWYTDNYRGEIWAISDTADQKTGLMGW